MTDGGAENSRIERIEIRPAASSDLPAISDLEAILFSDSWSLQMLKDSLEQSNYRIYSASVGGELCGYLLLSVVLDEAELLRIAVDKKYQGQGVGRILMEHLAQVCRTEQVARVYLEVRESNSRAISLYTGAGFQPNGCRKNYYKNPEENARLMVLLVESNYHCK